MNWSIMAYTTILKILKKHQKWVFLCEGWRTFHGCSRLPAVQHVSGPAAICVLGTQAKTQEQLGPAIACPFLRPLTSLAPAASQQAHRPPGAGARAQGRALTAILVH